jgi:hypothetical protein
MPDGPSYRPLFSFACETQDCTPATRIPLDWLSAVVR